MEPSQLTGTVTLVQERRFRLLDGDGRTHLFLLAHDAPVEPSQLRRLTAGAPVTVTCRRAPELIARIAANVFVAADAPPEELSR